MAQNLERGDSDTILYTNDAVDAAAFLAGRMRALQTNVGAATVAAGVCVLKNDCAINASVAAFVRGTFRYTAKAGAGEVWTAGVPIFYDTATDSLTQVSGVATCVYAGIAAAAKVNAAVVGFVILNVRAEGVSVAKAAGANPTQAEFAALIDALVAVGVIKFST